MVAGSPAARSGRGLRHLVDFLRRWWEEAILFSTALYVGNVTRAHVRETCIGVPDVLLAWRFAEPPHSVEFSAAAWLACAHLGLGLAVGLRVREPRARHPLLRAGALAVVLGSAALLGGFAEWVVLTPLAVLLAGGAGLGLARICQFVSPPAPEST